MASITVDLGPNVNNDDVVQLRKTLQDMGTDDEIIIRMEAADAHQADDVIDELEKRGFDYQPRGGDGRDYYIVARKRLVH